MDAENLSIQTDPETPTLSLMQHEMREVEDIVNGLEVLCSVSEPLDLESNFGAGASTDWENDELGIFQEIEDIVNGVGGSYPVLHHPGPQQQTSGDMQGGMAFEPALEFHFQSPGAGPSRLQVPIESNGIHNEGKQSLLPMTSSKTRAEDLSQQWVHIVFHILGSYSGLPFICSQHVDIHV
jgi:hypothetical protein